MKKKIVGLGEVLWDVFPDRSCLGGAPTNFAYITSVMGDAGIVASRVGEDSLGADALRRMNELGLDISAVQKDAAHRTGTVDVELDARGQARFEIAHPVAWDFLEWTPAWQLLAKQSDAVCFGSLAQRSEQSRVTIQRFLSATRPEAIKVFDVNLRQSFYSLDVLAESMNLTDIVKLNEEELPKIMNLLGVPHREERSSASYLLRTYNLKLVCITRGGRGSLLVHADQVHEHPGFRVKVADTVGSGDAFTAALVHEYLAGAPLDRMSEVANRVGAWVTSEVGATPVPKHGSLAGSLAEIQFQ
jgi:fructokinase